jgi:hypothetical protein
MRHTTGVNVRQSVEDCNADVENFAVPEGGRFWATVPRVNVHREGGVIALKDDKVRLGRKSGKGDVASVAVGKVGMTLGELAAEAKLVVEDPPLLHIWSVMEYDVAHAQGLLS